ncbi:DUF5343 domain-containing protein [Paracoccus suum]|uniref:DUF5343 domain-containing protein n=1 Tax=Paracoccus suum TaxID=2259340 RepID=UPI0013B0699F|nr:DUF5343 domain-containing protein [Paracoccus suum]
MKEPVTGTGEGEGEQEGEPGTAGGAVQEAESEAAKTTVASEKQAAREIKGNLPYTASPGLIKGVLDAVIAAERPNRLSNVYMETVFGLSGGGARSVPPILKKMGFLNSDGSPTDLYSKFKTETGRAAAALGGLKNAFPEIFRKNEVAHKATDVQLQDIVVEITGLTKKDPVLRHIINTFNNIKAYIPANFISDGNQARRDDEVEKVPPLPPKSDPGPAAATFGLSYQFNIVLPESQDERTFDAIFRSLKRNLLE